MFNKNISTDGPKDYEQLDKHIFTLASLVGVYIVKGIGYWTETSPYITEWMRPRRVVSYLVSFIV